MASESHDVRASLLRGLIDDASLFPPASLALPDALMRFHARRQGRYHAIAGRFVVAGTTIEPLMAAFDTRHGGIDLSVVLDAESLAASVATMRRMTEVLPQLALAAFEIRLPEREIDTGELVGWTQTLQELVQSESVEIFVETRFARDWTTAPSEIADTIEDAKSRTGDDALGAKVRCGGVAADAFPTPEQLASFVLAMRDAGLAWKATGGLHAALYRSGFGHGTHGFINLLAAALLANDRAIEDEEVAHVLSEESYDAFVLDERRFGWHDNIIHDDAVREGRDLAMRSYGSCSFDDPVDDLRRFGVVQ